MWSPTHVQVVVHRAKGLLTKGKNKSNDCFVTIALGKEKYQTSVKEKASENVDWHEECELAIPQQGNTAEIVLTALHRNFLGVDEFLGTVRIPLASFDIYEMPKNRWYELTGKPGKASTKDRGRLEVRVGFIVRAGSLTDLTKKERHKSSLGQLSSAAQSFGGSLLSIGSADKRKGQLKKLAKSIGSKVKGKSRSKAKLDDICDEDDDDGSSGIGELRRPRPRPRTTGQEHGDADPGVVSDDDDFTFDDLSHKSSNSSLNSSRTATTWKQSDNLTRDSGSPQLGSTNSRADSDSSKLTPPSKPPRFALNTPTTVATSTPLSNSSSNKPSTPASQQQQPQQQQQEQQKNVEDEWGKKLYGLQAGNTLKRWENKRSSPKVVVDEVRDNRQETTNSNNLSVNKVVSNNNANNTNNNSSINEDSPIARLRGEISAAINEAKHQGRKDKDKYKVNVVKGDSIESKREINNKKDKSLHKSSSERIIIGGEESQGNQLERLPRELIEQFDGKSREELIEQIVHLQVDVADKKKRLNDLEDYIDHLLLRVIESSPKLLQNPYPPGSRRLSSPGHQ